MRVLRALEEEAEVSADGELLRLLISLEESSWSVTDQSGDVTVDKQGGALAKSQHGIVVEVMELQDSLLARLPLVLTFGLWVEIVRVDVEWCQLKCVERRGQANRHVVRCVN